MADTAGLCEHSVYHPQLEGPGIQLDPELARARKALPVTEDQIYLSTGSLGPMSSVFSVTLRRCTLDDLHHGRFEAERFAAMASATEAIRREIASIVSVPPAEIALTRSTSDSLRAVIDGFPFEPGDEVVCTQLEHPACTNPLSEGARKRRFDVTLAQVPEDGAEDLAWLEACVTPRTRLIAFSAVGYTTGQLLPIARIGRFARAHGIYTLVDGAQCIGAVETNLAEAGIDFCAFPLQKWLCGPEGLGALYVRSGSIESLRRDRFTQSRGVLEATAAHLAWMRESIGWSWVHERTARLAGSAREALAAAPGIRLETPEMHAGLVTIEVSGAACEKARTAESQPQDLARYRPLSAVDGLLQYGKGDRDDRAPLRLAR
jgi:L-cysteine/cystine lyase